jgi:hypothetical protein
MQSLSYRLEQWLDTRTACSLERLESFLELLFTHVFLREEVPAWTGGGAAAVPIVILGAVS